MNLLRRKEVILTYDPHPASLVFPLMGGTDYSLLLKDIQQNGLLEPIALSDGMILDGRNRYRACMDLGITPTFVEADLGELTPLQYVVSKNLHRRHLTVAQRAALALELLPELEAAARERMAEGGRISKRGQPMERDNNHRNAPQSSIQAAEILGIGKSTVQAAKAIAARDPQVIERMRSGELKTVADGAREAGFPRLGQSGHKLQVKTLEGKIPSYGKGDKWDDASTPIRRYLKGWETRNFEFRHINVREAKRRLRALKEIQAGLSKMEHDLSNRSRKATLRLEE